jgi:Flp pilus assembly protein TadG
MRRHHKNQRGQAYIEFIVVLPGVLLLTLIAWEFAYFWWGRMIVSTATFEAARQVAIGESPATGYATYNGILETGLGRMSEDYTGHSFTLTVQPSSRSVRAQANVPWHWPSGLAAMMGGEMNLHLKSSAFFRLEQLHLGPPEQFE